MNLAFAMPTRIIKRMNKDLLLNVKNRETLIVLFLEQKALNLSWESITDRAGKGQPGAFCNFYSDILNLASHFVRMKYHFNQTKVCSKIDLAITKTIKDGCKYLNH